jgi:pyridoxamine 5'-phosphate oxidase
MTSYLAPLLERHAPRDPMALFDGWFRQAQREVRMPEAMVLATAGRDLRPSARMVLAKQWGRDGFVFYTDYRSRKLVEIDANPRGALLLYWDPPGRQVRVEGPLERLTPQESDSYFATRPRGSQIAAHTSVQSQPIASRELLEERFAQQSRRFEGDEVPRPSFWGGVRLVPETMEFWQQRPDRLHDRLLYTLVTGGWVMTRIQP